MDRGALRTTIHEQRVVSATALALLAFASVHLIWRLCDYSGCFPDVEVFLSWFPSVFLTGKGFSFSDLGQAIDVWGMDGDSRPRFLSYYLAALTVKARIALWDWLPPHPSFSPLWPFTLVMAPWLFYRFLKEELECRWSAIVGASLYMLSTGYLSSATMLFHPGKPLANVVVIATLYVAMKARKTLLVEKNSPVGILPKTAILFSLLLLPLLLLADETALFCLFILPVWAHRFFIPRRFEWAHVKPCLVNSFFMSFPAVFYLAVAFVVAPLLTNNVLQRSYSFGDYLHRSMDIGKTGFISLAQHTTTLFSAVLIPWKFLNRRIPVEDATWHPVGMLIVVLAIFLALFTMIYRDRTRRPLLFRLTTLLALFLLFQTFVAAHHPQQLTVTGYYYGAIFSVLVSALLAAAYVSLSRTSIGRVAAVAITLCLAINMSCNYSQLNSSWLSHRNFKGYQLITKAVYNPFFAHVDLSQLVKYNSKTVEGIYLDDIPSGFRGDQAGWIFRLWKGRSDGRYQQLLRGHVLAFQDLWVLFELYNWHTPRDVSTISPADIPAPIAINDKLLRAYRGILRRSDYTKSGAVPLFALKNIARPNRYTIEYETKLAYPWLYPDIDGALRYLHGFRYTHILVTDDMLLPDGSYGLLHNQFIREKLAGSLEKHGLISRGSFVVDGHIVTLFEIRYFPTIT